MSTEHNISHNPENEFRQSMAKLAEFKVKTYSPSEDMQRGFISPSTMLDVAEQAIPFIREVAISNVFQDETEDHFAAVVTVIGATASGKNELASALDAFWSPTTSADISHLRWENDEDLLLHQGKINKNVYEPFDSDDLNLVARHWEPNTSEDIVSGGLHIVVKPSGTYGKVRSTSNGDTLFSVVVRPFGTDSLHKFSTLKPPFHKLKPELVTHVASIGITASPTITYLLSRHRAALQMCGENLDMANWVQARFNSPAIPDMKTLIDLQEGGSMKQLCATNAARLEVIQGFAIRGLLHNRIPRFAVQIINRALTPQDAEEIFSVTTDDVIAQAEQLCRYIHREPTNYQIAEVIHLHALSLAEQVVCEANLQIAGFDQPRPLRPKMGCVVRNEPKLTQYEPTGTREVIERFELNKDLREFA